MMTAIPRIGTDVISHATVHNSANEDLGTYERPGTLAADVGFLSPGTKSMSPLGTLLRHGRYLS